MNNEEMDPAGGAAQGGNPGHGEDHGGGDDHGSGAHKPVSLFVNEKAVNRHKRE